MSTVENYELRTGYRPTQQLDHNRRFLKGHIPWNKGRKWSEYLSEDTQRRVKAIGIKNLHAPHKGHAPTNNRHVIAIDSEGRLTRHESLHDASVYFGIGRENIGRCCRLNHHGIEPTRSWKKINTDHKYMGIRFYFEEDVQVWSNARRRRYI